jgi:16S rRNA (guanine966-N2)-methyltransferase
MGVIHGASVVDLYAGTGALGLESASRGARSVVLVEKNSTAAEICEQNSKLVTAGLQKAGMSTEIRVVREAAEKYCQKNPRATLVFIDPPYEQSNDKIIEHLLQLEANDQLVVVLERSSKTSAPDFPTSFELHSQKEYGDTRIYLLTRGFSH